MKISAKLSRKLKESKTLKITDLGATVINKRIPETIQIIFS